MINLTTYEREFSELLGRVDSKVKPQNTYSQRYLRYLILHREYYISIYSLVIRNVLNKVPKSAAEITLVDYGAGNGLLALFAMHCGFKRVMCVEINPEFVEASKNLAGVLGLDDIDFICGDVEDLRAHVQKDQIAIDALVGTDVIEHIYDLEKFLYACNVLNHQITLVFTTAANAANPILKRRIKGLQHKDEWVGNVEDNAGLLGEAHPSYISMRTKIIRDLFPDMDNIHQLAVATRSLAGNDLRLAIEAYHKDGTFPKPQHNTNCCHPNTGSWTERLLTIAEYRSLFLKNNFLLEVQHGFYDVNKPLLIRLVNILRNMILKILGVKFSPFIILIGHKK